MKRWMFVLGILAPLFSLSQESNTPSFVLMEGPAGMYLFLTDQVPIRGEAYKYQEIKVLRASGKSSRFEEIGNVKALPSLEEFRQKYGSKALEGIMGIKELKSEQEAWSYILEHPDISGYGFLTFDLTFLEEMGFCFVDRSIKDFRTGEILKYRVEYVTNEATARNLAVENLIEKGMQPLILKPKVQTITEGDSMISITWRSAASGSEDALFGAVWRREGDRGAFQQIGSSFANSDSQANTLTYVIDDKVIPGRQYAYFVVPLTMTLMPGPPSDTAYALSANFLQLPQSGYMTASDTLSGIRLQWKPLERTTFYAGLVIERSLDPQQGFEPIDTIPASASSFLDVGVVPNLLYHYQIRWLTIRQNLLEPAARTSAMHSSENLFLEAPEQYEPTVENRNIRLTWKPNASPETAGYFVYRQDGGVGDWNLVSNLLTDPFFIDTTAMNPRITYGYAIQATNFSDGTSPLSNIVYASPRIPALPPAPLGLRAAVDGNRVLLEWQDMRPNDNFITGYNVYKKSSSYGTNGDVTGNSPAGLRVNGYNQLNPEILTSPQFTDADPGEGAFASYAVVSVNVFGEESLCQALLLKLDQQLLLLPPSEIYLREVNGGIEVSWDENLQKEVIGYVIYRRTAAETAARELDVVNATNSSYFDAAASAGTLYFYSVATLFDSGRSAPGGEKGIRVE